MAEQKARLTPWGKLMKKRLIDLEMSQVELAALLGVNKNYITRIMTGERAGTKYRKAIAEILGIPDAA